MDVTLVVLAIVVVLVAIDAIGRLDERRHRNPSDVAGDAVSITTQKIVVDLTGRDRD
ncbi:MAG: hypothetical protein H0V17_28335 [Deltaproteobacteria bacterium]|nr:hypothetical protein [Deltaproteobacteria bacterium]